MCLLTGLVFPAFFLAYWLVFCSPQDVWFKLLKQGAILVPLKAFETIRYGVLISTLGMDKALVAEHPKMRQSVCLHSLYSMSAASKACQELVKRVCSAAGKARLLALFLSLARSLSLAHSLSISRSLALYLSLARSLSLALRAPKNAPIGMKAFMCPCLHYIMHIILLVL